MQAGEAGEADQSPEIQRTEKLISHHLLLPESRTAAHREPLVPGAEQAAADRARAEPAPEPCGSDPSCRPRLPGSVRGCGAARRLVQPLRAVGELRSDGNPERSPPCLHHGRQRHRLFTHQSVFFSRPRWLDLSAGSGPTASSSPAAGGKTAAPEQKGACSSLFSELVAETGKICPLCHVFLPERAAILLEKTRCFLLENHRQNILFRFFFQNKAIL